jgi:hypothetical protein
MVLEGHGDMRRWQRGRDVDSAKKGIVVANDGARRPSCWHHGMIWSYRDVALLLERFTLCLAVMCVACLLRLSSYSELIFKRLNTFRAVF